MSNLSPSEFELLKAIKEASNAELEAMVMLCKQMYWHQLRSWHLSKMERKRAEEKNPLSGPLDWVCPECGCDECEEQFWVGVNTNEIFGSANEYDYWCPACEDHNKRLMQRHEYENEVANGQGDTKAKS